MSALKLSLSEQKASLSGKKKKKQTLKNVLCIPVEQKTQSHRVELVDDGKLKQILERLLPTARLSFDQDVTKNKESKDLESKPRAEAKKKRDQLLIGVNAVTRGVKKKSVEAVLLASDIQPQFLTHHLNLMCEYNQVPTVHTKELRNITRNCLGFPCIALGFKKNSTDFADAVKEIQTASQIGITEKNEDNKDSPCDLTDSSDEEKTDSLTESKISFNYLFRTSNQERVFKPGKTSTNNNKPSKAPDFIKVNKSDSETKFQKESSQIGISSKFKSKKRKFKKLNEIEGPEFDENLDLPKKRVKRDWFIDTKGETKKNIKYLPANLIKVSSNSMRVKKE